jgi:hypothetical protein
MEQFMIILQVSLRIIVSYIVFVISATISMMMLSHLFRNDILDWGGFPENAKVSIPSLIIAIYAGYKASKSIDWGFRK